MRTYFALLTVFAFALTFGAIAFSQDTPDTAHVTATPAPSSHLQTPPPTIYEAVSRPICLEMKQHVLPVVGMVLENDRLIGKAPPIFKDYILTALRPDPSNKTGYDVTDYDSPGRTMALEHMTDLVPALAHNTIEIKNILTNSTLAEVNGNTPDAKALEKIRDQLIRTLATQDDSLDLINGFVQTQQLGDIQHAGDEYLSNINATGLTNSAPQPGSSANPAFQDPNAPGVAQDPHFIETGNIPGLAVGYNPVAIVADALEWVRGQTSDNENDVAKSLTAIGESCRTGAPLPEVPATPSPQ
jgi:hypothetical protein